MATRSDVYNLAADVALETAIASVMAVDTGSITGNFGEGAKNITRKEALRFLVRRAMKKEVGNRTRRVAANEPGTPQS
jgi:hypothetical protein